MLINKDKFPVDNNTHLNSTPEYKNQYTCYNSQSYKIHSNQEHKTKPEIKYPKTNKTNCTSITENTTNYIKDTINKAWKLQHCYTAKLQYCYQRQPMNITKLQKNREVNLAQLPSTLKERKHNFTNFKSDTT